MTRSHIALNAILIKYHHYGLRQILTNGGVRLEMTKAKSIFIATVLDADINGMNCHWTTKAIIHDHLSNDHHLYRLRHVYDWRCRGALVRVELP
jgi:hypothetical protein